MHGKCLDVFLYIFLTNICLHFDKPIWGSKIRRPPHGFMPKPLLSSIISSSEGRYREGYSLLSRLGLNEFWTKLSLVEMALKGMGSTEADVEGGIGLSGQPRLVPAIVLGLFGKILGQVIGL